MVPAGSRRPVTSLFLLSPALVLLLITVSYPLIYSWITSLQYYQVFRPQDRRFVGLSNYVFLFRDPQFWHSLRLTITYTFTAVALELLVGGALAIWTFSLHRQARLARLLITLPILISPAIAALTWRFMYGPDNGIINATLRLAGLPSGDWLNRPSTALGAVILTDVWQWAPFVFIALLAGIAAIPRSVLEASRLDGASFRQYTWHIMLPMLRPLILIIVLIRAIDTFRAFDQIYLLTNGGPGTSTYLLSFYASIVGFNNYDVGLASALGVVILNVVLALTAALVYLLGRDLL